MNISKFLPDKNIKFREGQAKAISDLVHKFEDGNKIVSLNAPTASGKTLIMYVAGSVLLNEYNKSDIVITSPQVALVTEGNFWDLPKLVGKSNYDCVSLDGCTADECPFTSKEQGFFTCDNCLYRMAKRRFAYSSFKVVTFSRYAIDPSISRETSVLFIDESSDLENELLKQSVIELNINLDDVTKRRDLNGKLEDLKKYIKEFDVVGHFEEQHEELVDVCSILSKKCKDMRKEIFGDDNKSKPDQKKLKELKAVQREYRMYHRKLTTCNKVLHYIKLEVPYIITCETAEKYNPVLRKKIMDPVSYFRLLDAKVPFAELVTNLDFVVLASGTPTTELLTSKFCEVKMLHPIPVEKRQVFYVPVGYMNYASRDKTSSLIATKISDLHKKYGNKNTIVHCGSYVVANMIYDTLKKIHKSVVIQENGYREEALRRWINNDNSIFLSVKYEEGISLDGPRFPLNIIAKVPFPNPYDPWVAKRNDLDKQMWYRLGVATLIQQACGRCTRAPDDFSHTYILDASFGNFYAKHKYLFQDWFIKSLNGV